MQDPAENPQRFVHVALADGDEKKIRVLEGHLFVS